MLGTKKATQLEGKEHGGEWLEMGSEKKDNQILRAV